MQVQRYLKFELWVVAVVVAAVGLAGWASQGKAKAAEASYELVGEGLEPFRSAFNAASGDVRAVLLVGPT